MNLINNKMLKNGLSVLAFCFGTLVLVAQSKELKKADEAAKQGLIAEAIQFYQDAQDKGYQLTSRESLALADLNYTVGNYSEAAKGYKGFYDAGLRDTATSLLKYAYCLNVNKDQEGYQKVLDKLVSDYPNDSRISKIKDLSFKRNKSLLNFTHKVSDTINNVISVVSTNGVVFATSLSNETDQLVTIDNNNNTNAFNSEWKFNQGGVAVAADGQSMIVTLNLHKGNKLAFENRTISNLNLYRVEFSNGVWSEPSKLSVNATGYNSANPSLSVDGKTLYFVSDRPRGKGATDIYKATLQDDGNFGVVTNMGDKVNTEGKESFVFVDKNDIMYFSSDGFPGYGGMDIYALDLKDPSAKVFNLGYPINTPYDDFGYSRGNLEGYISSNRLGHLASFKYVMSEELVLNDQFKANLQLANKDINFGKPVSVVVRDPEGVEVYRKEYKVLESTISVPELSYNNSYTVSIEGEHIKDAQFGVEVKPSVNSSNNKQSVDVVVTAAKGVKTGASAIAASNNAQLADQVAAVKNDQNAMQAIQAVATVSEDGLNQTGVTSIEGALENQADTVAIPLALESNIEASESIENQLSLAPINFDFDHYQAVVSDEVVATYVKALSSAKSATIKGYSDQRGLASYNKKLSLKRAEFFRDMLIENGVSIPLSVEGRGETDLINNCRDQVCTPEMEQENRRVELFIQF